MKNVYIVRYGGLNKSTNCFDLTNRYFSSLSKAKKDMENIIKICEGENIEPSFNTNLNDTIIEGVDFIAEGGKYKCRVLIEQHKMN